MKTFKVTVHNRWGIKVRTFEGQTWGMVKMIFEAFHNAHHPIPEGRTFGYQINEGDSLRIEAEKEESIGLLERLAEMFTPFPYSYPVTTK